MQYSEEEKSKWLENWKISGKSAWAYAKTNGLNPQTFVKWSKAGTERKQCFIEVPKRALPTLHQVQEILIEREEVKIHIPLNLGRGELGSIMEWLRAAL